MPGVTGADAAEVNGDIASVVSKACSGRMRDRKVQRLFVSGCSCAGKLKLEMLWKTTLICTFVSSFDLACSFCAMHGESFKLYIVRCLTSPTSKHITPVLDENTHSGLAASLALETITS